MSEINYDDEIDSALDVETVTGRGNSRFQKINFISASNEPRYAGTALQVGGFQIPVRKDMELPEDRSGFEEVSLGKDNIALATNTLHMAVIGMGPQTRRYIVEVNDVINGKEQVVTAGHVDIAPKFWREICNTDFGKSLQSPSKYEQGKLVDPKSIRKLFVVLKGMPNRVWELGLKGGNANVPRDLEDALYVLADMQTVIINKRLADKGKRQFDHTLAWYVNYVPFSIGATMAYAPRADGKNSGGFTRFSIGWPNIHDPRDYKPLVKFQRQFTRMDQFGEKVHSMQELSEARKALKQADIEAMYVGGAQYNKFAEMRAELDELLMNGYINPLESQTAILEAIEEVKRGYFERSIAINSRQLPPAAPADDGPRNRDEWEDAKQSLAQNPPTASAQAPSNGKPSQTDTKVPTLWSVPTMQEFKKGVIMGWADATDKEHDAMVSSVTVQYMMRIGNPPEWKGEPDAKQVAKVIGNLITWDEVNAEEKGEVAY